MLTVYSRSFNIQYVALKYIWALRLRLSPEKAMGFHNWEPYFEKLTETNPLNVEASFLLIPHFSYSMGKLMFSSINPPYQFLFGFSSFILIRNIGHFLYNLTILNGILNKHVQPIEE
ncbi:hypothetical protein RF11_14773 [Thelohanellus kitauei]|uniref:Uncharacterized protein n=1 Tax=Thelohanellus kitauei TaxID=669202 RepID=A0A0C2JJE3_THEKT|nr:hypothetical protein RF11_14773 [Thelohanellus kitauei]